MPNDQGNIIAFVPARGGSKSIPYKNIKLIANKPLIYWVLKSLQDTPEVDQIVVATDDLNIKSTVLNFAFSKVITYDRDPINAQDTSSTESVLLEYIESQNISDESWLLLAQATSPLTTSTDFSKAIALTKAGFSSVLSCVENRRFFWSADGTSINYNVLNRPRRQDFNGQLMENGALYLSSVRDIKATKCRISGKIGIMTMPEVTAFEIDEPDDWIILESLVSKYRTDSSPVTTFSNIKILLSDVDGVLTDAGMYYSENGDELKKFSTYDGLGFRLLAEKGIQCGILTQEDRQLNQRRSQKLKLDFTIQGSHDKVKSALELCQKLGFDLSNIAYIGDDVNDIELLKAVSIKACPANAVPEVKAIPGIIHLQRSGGDGALREFAEILLRGL